VTVKRKSVTLVAVVSARRERKVKEDREGFPVIREIEVSPGILDRRVDHPVKGVRGEKEDYPARGVRQVKEDRWGYPAKEDRPEKKVRLVRQVPVDRREQMEDFWAMLTSIRSLLKHLKRLQ